MAGRQRTAGRCGAHSKVKEVAKALVASGKGILAVDDFTPGIIKRFASLNIPCTDDSRRDYREMLFTSQGMEHISGVILYDETFRQSARSGAPIPLLISQSGALIGIKLDLGQALLPFTNQELITKGLDDLEQRLSFYKEQGASFAKWRGVLSISDRLPSLNAMNANAHSLARYAAICQSHGIVPIVEPDILMAGDHTAERCEAVTRDVLARVFDELALARVDLSAIVLKPNMITAGSSCPRQAPPDEVAGRTLVVLTECVPAEVPGIAFLSGGQSEVQATQHLNLMVSAGALPWALTFSYNRALQDSTLKVWAGKDENITLAQKAFTQRAKMNSLAALGLWSAELERNR
jgi:fructose-bisphosphate aldolase, class I